MKKYFLIIILVILGVAVYGYIKSVPGIKNNSARLPKIEITPEFFDFGIIEYGKIVEFGFKIKNLGNEPLEIKRVATSCACTSAKAALEIINPGQETNLKVTYNTGAMSGSHGKGKQERIIYVKSSDPVNPQEEIMIQAYVQ